MLVAPSLLSADFSCLSSELKDIERGGADLVHLDVMDNHFVPNLTFGAPVIQKLRPCTKLPFDVHLMIEHPESIFDSIEKAGAQMISIHAETVVHLDKLIRDIQSRHIKAGIALNPGTSLYAIDEILPLLDYVLIMSVNPGFGGQKFISSSLQKIKRLKEMMKEKNHVVPIEVDGGVNKDNISLLKEAGADIVVAGSAVFGQKDRAAAIQALKI
jgi:ribulose-phosphate 3-epimerase